VWLAIILYEVWIECFFWEDNTVQVLIDEFVMLPATIGCLDYYLVCYLVLVL